MRQFRIVKGPLTVWVGSTVQNEVGVPRDVATGTRLALQMVAPNGNVWFMVPKLGRAKIEAGSIESLVKRGVLEEEPAGTIIE